MESRGGKWRSMLEFEMLKKTCILECNFSFEFGGGIPGDVGV